MSLKVAAQHLSAKGRGPDDTLVHMSRGEVKSLNDLAMAHGGQLTINPQTGLPEAGFLSAILPMVAGAALTGLSGGAINPLTAGMIVGAGSYALNPKAGLMGGLMAGMGAYGGAGLGEALAQQGMEQAAGQSMLEGQVAENTAKMGQNVAYPMGTDPTKYGYGLSGDMASGDMVAKLSGPQYGAGMSTADLNAGLANQSITERLGTMGQGVKSLGTEGGFSNLYNRMGGGMGTAKNVLAAAAPLATLQKDESVAPVVDKDMGQRYTYSPGVAQPLPAADVPTYEDMLTKQGNFGKQQNYYPNQGYTKVSSDEAKNIYGFANGGPVEQMSNNAMMGVNTMYPMANMATPSFATPYQSPVSTNMLSPTSDSPVGMSGEPSMQGTRMAEGGSANESFLSAIAHSFGVRPKKEDENPGLKYAYNPEQQQYQQMAEGGEANATPAYTYDAQAQKYISSAPTAPMNAGAGEGISSAMGMTYNPLTQQFTGGNLPTGQIYLGGGQYGVDEATKRAQAEAAAAAASDGGYAPGAARGGLMDYADGGLSNARYNLGGYSDGGRLLRGPGDGVSDSIPAVIGKRQPARLADGEFVVPARIVSEIGNGSTEAGARKLYGMMDRVQAARGKTVGKGRVAKNTRADKYLPA